MKDISGQLELKYIKAKNLKIKRLRFCGDHVLFGLHSFDWMFGSLVVAIIFLLFQWAIYVACARVSETCVSLVGGMTQFTVDSRFDEV